jgi:Na+-transporting methylmalonyl-CoA/oxaloacetate decarboxylase beta subunit
VARRVRDDELALRRGEVAVRNVDGDFLLPLRAQAVGEQRQAGVIGSAVTAGVFLALLR